MDGPTGLHSRPRPLLAPPGFIILSRNFLSVFSTCTHPETRSSVPRNISKPRLLSSDISFFFSFSLLLASLSLVGKCQTRRRVIYGALFLSASRSRKYQRSKISRKHSCAHYLRICAEIFFNVLFHNRNGVTLFFSGDY